MGYNDHTGEVIVLEDGSDSDSVMPDRSQRHSKSQVLAEQAKGLSDRKNVSEIIDLTLADETDLVDCPPRKRRHGIAKDESWEWSCRFCTFRNAPWLDSCGVCNSENEAKLRP